MHNRHFSNHLYIDALIRDIKTDVQVAKQSLARKQYADTKEHNLFFD